MKNIKITWKASFFSAVILIIISLALSSAATGMSLWNSLLKLPLLPLGVFEAIFAPVLFWVGAAFSAKGNPNGPMELFIACLSALLALLLIIVGLIDFFKKNKPVQS